eukprot:COSAG01_NODE_4069_length_5383_cov_6.046556_3_plen_160_part_00
MMQESKTEREKIILFRGALPTRRFFEYVVWRVGTLLDVGDEDSYFKQSWSRSFQLPTKPEPKLACAAEDSAPEEQVAAQQSEQPALLRTLSQQERVAAADADATAKLADAETAGLADELAEVERQRNELLRSHVFAAPARRVRRSGEHQVDFRPARLPI